MKVFGQDNVDQQRTGFTEMLGDGPLFAGELSWPDIEEAVLSASQEYLQPYTASVRIEKNERIREHVKSKAPEYRHIVHNHPERLEEIPPGLSDEALDVHLYELHRSIEIDLRKEADELLNVGLQVDDPKLYEEQRERLARFWQEYNEVGKANLAKYIVHRKLVLTFLENALKRQGTGKYLYEEAVHQFIFPLKTTSDELSYDQHNLWIIDEKLAYHRYLASDKPFKSMDPLDVDSGSRPDLITFFDNPIADSLPVRRCWRPVQEALSIAL
jgi:hypothetical protein